MNYCCCYYYYYLAILLTHYLLGVRQADERHETRVAALTGSTVTGLANLGIHVIGARATVVDGLR